MKSTPNYATSAARRRLPIFWILGVTLLAVSAIGSGVALRSQNGTYVGTEAAAAERMEQGPPVVATGYVDSKQEIRALLPTQSGRVTRIMATEGQQVDKGAPLLEVDDYVAQRDVQKAKANYEAALEQVKVADEAVHRYPLQVQEQEESIKAAQHSYQAALHAKNRAKSLADQNFANADQAKAEEEKANALEDTLTAMQIKLKELKLHDPVLDLVRAKLDAEAKQALLEQAEYARAECRLLAPVAGTVLRVLANAGDLSGPQAKQPALFFCPDGPRIVRADVEQEFAGRVAVGQLATIQDDTTMTTTWHGKVIRVSDWYTQRRTILPEPIQLHDIRTLECIVELDAGQSLPRINQRMRVTLGK